MHGVKPGEQRMAESAVSVPTSAASAQLMSFDPRSGALADCREDFGLAAKETDALQARASQSVDNGRAAGSNTNPNPARNHSNVNAVTPQHLSDLPSLDTNIGEVRFSLQSSVASETTVAGQASAKGDGRFNSTSPDTNQRFNAQPTARFLPGTRSESDRSSDAGFFQQQQQQLQQQPQPQQRSADNNNFLYTATTPNPTHATEGMYLPYIQFKF
jgi:hypothetical protein